MEANAAALAMWIFKMDRRMIVFENPAYIGSLGERQATVSGICGSLPPRKEHKPAADKDPTAPRVKAQRASVDPQSFDRWILAVG